MGPHQRGWLNEACATPQRRQPHHELVQIWTVFLSEQHWVTGFVETAAGRAANCSLHNTCTRFKIVRNLTWWFSWQTNFCTAAWRACTEACAFWRRVWHAFEQVSLSTMHVQVCILNRCFDISVHICGHTRCRLCACIHVCTAWQFFHSALGNEGGGVNLVDEGTCCLAWGLIVDKRRYKGVVCVISIFNAGGSVCGCMCVYTHRHTHAAHGVFGCEHKGRLQTPGGPEESRWTKSRHIFIR